MVRLTDAAGFTSPPLMLHLAWPWPDDIRSQLQDNVLSMPAGEGIGVVVLADAVLRELGGVTHLIAFSDSSPVVAMLNSDNSGSPQLNFLMKWLIEAHPTVQTLGIHQRGVRNTAADDLSRGRAERVLEEARASGAHCLALAPSPALDWLTQAAARMPQRSAPPPSQAK